MNPRPLTVGRTGFAAGLIGLLIVLAVLILVGVRLYREEVESIVDQQHNTLTAVAELKVHEINQWRKEGAFDVWRLANGKFLQENMGKLSQPGGAEEIRRLPELQPRHQGENILIFSPEGRLLMRTRDSQHEAKGPPEPAQLNLVREALTSPGAVVSDLYRCSEDHVHIDFAAAIRDGDGHPLGVLVMRQDAEDYLYPLVKLWPLPSETAESLLVARDGDEVVFLNNLRHHPDSALRLRIPMSRKDLPTVQMLEGRTGVREGIDYRGVPVLADVLPIDGSPWLLVAKIDRSEVFRDLPRRVAGIGMALVLLLLLAGILVAVLFIRRQSFITRRLRDSEHRFRSVIEASPVPFTLHDARGRITYINSAFTRAFGCDIEDVPTLNAWWLKACPDPEYRRKFLVDWAAHIEISRKTGKPFRPIELNLRSRSGESLTVLGMAAPMAGEDGENTIIHFYDITPRKVLENNLLEALGRAESASKAKSEFLAVMSHELRTPLNGVLGFADLLSETELNREQREFVNTIQGSGSHLLQVVNDILDFSSMEKKGVQLEITRVGIADIVQSACAAVVNSAASKGLDFQSCIADGVPGSIEGDPLRIRQILINLLGNAVKFTSHGSVSLSVHQSNGSRPAMIEFSVEDTGPGISAGTLARLFQPFTQADSTLHRHIEGTGLGLAISRRLAEAMGGRIDVVSTPGKGSIFTLCIPTSPTLASKHPAADPPHPAPSAARKPGAGTRRLLVVEDDQVSALLIRRILTSLGLEADLAGDGRRGIEAFVPGKYSAILMDMQMPDVDGIGATRAIRAIERDAGSPRVLIIALTANVMPGDRETCLEAGMDDFLTKPLNKSALTEKLAAIMTPVSGESTGEVPAMAGPHSPE